MKISTFILIFTITAGTLNAQSTTGISGKVKIEVDGLSCPFCAYGLEKNLKELEGAEEIKIDVENAFVLFSITKGETIDEAILRKKIVDAGFTPKKIARVID